MPLHFTLYTLHFTLLLSRSQWAGLCVNACCEFLVELVETIAVVAYHAELIHEVSSVLLFLYLLVHEPVESALEGEVFLLYSKCHEVVDEGSHFAFVLKSVLESSEWGSPFGVHSSDWLQQNATATALQLVEEYHSVVLFLFELDSKPVSDTWVACILAVR